MKIIENTKLIKRNRLLSRIIFYITIAVLIVEVYLSLTNSPYTQGINAYGVLIVAFFLVQFTILFGNRWGRSPRIDEIINSSLKGLDDKYSIYQYMGNVNHLLIGPAGIWAINPFHQRGTILFDAKKKKYVQKGGGNFLSKVISGDSIADVIHYSKLARTDVKKMFSKYGIEDYPEPVIANIFFDPDAIVKAHDGPELTMHVKNLKDHVRQVAKKNQVPEKTINSIISKLPGDNI